ncbi:MAG TPA: Gfo/Idh/MocA family oxidoreductase [Candidatus Acidoferrales bacterium]
MRVGIIGSGFIAKQKHLPAWKKAGRDAQVVALSDPNLAQAEELARAHGITGVYKDYRQMLEAEKLDVVDICSPPRTHAELAIRSLKAGAHALIEKPMAINTEECDQILAVAQEHRRKICVAHSDLFYPSFLKAREIVKQGSIGDFGGMRIFLSTPVDYITSKPDHWAHRLPGGVIGETGPHVIYMALAFINPIQRVRVEARKQLKQFPWSPYEDYRLELMGENATCSVALTYATNRWAVQLDVWGSEGHLKFDLETQTLIVHGRSDLKPVTLGISAVKEAGQMLGGTLGTSLSYLTGKFENTHERLIREFVESIRNGTSTPVPPGEGREAVRVMDLLVSQLAAVSA